MALHLLICLAVTGGNEAGAEEVAFGMDKEPVDTSNWIDPWDMGPDPTTGSKNMKRTESKDDGAPSMKDKFDTLKRDRNGAKIHRKPTNAAASPPSVIDKIKECSSCAHCNTQLKECRKKISTLQNSTSSPSRELKRANEDLVEFDVTAAPSSSSDMLYLQRHVNFLIRRLSLKEHAALATTNDAKFSAELLLSTSDIRTLVDFANIAENIGEEKRRAKMAEIDEILSRYMDNVLPYRSNTASINCFQDYSSMLYQLLPSAVDLTCAIMACLSFSAFFFVWKGVPLRKVIIAAAILLVLISSAWHWVHLYKKAVSKRHAAIMESQNPPKECFPEEMSLSDYLFNAMIHSSYSANDKCAKYHEAFMVDPFWEVSPTIAIVETFTNFVLLPLEHLGRNLGRFYSSLVAELPVMSQFYVIPFVFIGFLFITIMVFRYKINLPFWLGSIEPIKSRPAVSVEEELRVLKEAYCLQQEKIRLLETVRSELRTVGGKKVEEIECLEKSELPQKGKERSSSKERSNQSPPVLSPPQGWKDAISVAPVTQTPRKKLVAVGEATSPTETAFEWVTDPSLGEESAEHLEETATVGVADDVEGFLNRVETVFQREN